MRDGERESGLAELRVVTEFSGGELIGRLFETEGDLFVDLACEFDIGGAAFATGLDDDAGEVGIDLIDLDPDGAIIDARLKEVGDGVFACERAVEGEHFFGGGDDLIDRAFVTALDLVFGERDTHSVASIQCAIAPGEGGGEHQERKQATGLEFH